MVIGVIVEPEQTDCELTEAVAVGLGLTCTVAVMGLPVQLPLDGVMVNVTVRGAPVLLVSVPLILPVPLAAMPVTDVVLSLVHLYVPPLMPLKAMVVIDAPVQIDCEEGVAVALIEEKSNRTQGSLEQKSTVSSL
jgi:hypothetical protein